MPLPLSILIPLISLLSYLLYTYILHPTLISPLRHLPPLSPFSRILPSTYYLSIFHPLKPYTTLHKSHTLHGPIIRLGPSEISVCSSEGLRKIYTAGLDKDVSYRFFENFGGVANLVSLRGRAEHGVQKRGVSAVYAKSFLGRSGDMRGVESGVGGGLLGRLEEIVRGDTRGKGECEVMFLAQCVGMDFMTGYLFGLGVGTDWLGEEGEARRYLAEYEKRRLSPGQPEYAERVCMRFCEKALRGIRGEGPLGRTRPVVFEKLYVALEKMLTAQGKTYDEVMRRVASEMMDQMLAAHETTSITLTYVVWHLSRNQGLQRRLGAELSTLGKILRPADNGDGIDLPDASAIDALPLLNSILMETLRLHSAVPGPLPRVVPSEGMTLHGYFIPGGTIVSSNAYTLHRDESIYPDAESWQADRWIQNSEDSGKIEGSGPMRRFFWAFGSGGRMCVGSNFAIQILKLTLAVIYSNYTTSIVDDEGIEQEQGLISRPRGNKLVVKLQAVE